MLSGRVSCDPDLPDDLFVDTFAARYPGADARALFAATAAASKIIPQTTRFYWHDEDLNWPPEACAQWDDAQGSRLYTVAQFMSGATMPNSKILNIRQWSYRKRSKGQMEAMTPLQVADVLSGFAGDTLKTVTRLRANPVNLATRDLRQIVGDNDAMAHLGTYYAEKIRSACDLALFDGTHDEKHRRAAIAHLELALAAWKRYAAIHDAQYLPNFLARIGWIDLTTMTQAVAQDLDIARQWRPGRLLNKQ